MTFLDFVKEDKKATAYRSYRKRIERWLSADARIKLFRGYWPEFVQNENGHAMLVAWTSGDTMKVRSQTTPRLYVLSLTIEEYLKTKPPKE